MGNILLVLVVAVVLVAVVSTALLTVPSRRHTVARREISRGGLHRLRRVSLTTRWAALVAGGALVVLAADLGGLGRGLMLAPVMFGGAQILGVLIADAISQDDAREPGVAALETRRARDLLPRALTWISGCAGIALIGVLAWTTSVASADDQGRSGRSLVYDCVTVCDHASVGPWPGSFYSLPLIICLVVVVALAAVVLRHAARRPRNGTDPEVLQVDGAIRRRAAESAVAGAGVAIVGSLTGIAAMVGMRLADAEHAPSTLGFATWPAFAVALAAFCATIWCLAVLLVPGPRRTPTGASSAAVAGMRTP